MGSRYSRWDGSQQFDEDPVQDLDLIGELSDDLLSGISPQQAIRRLLRRGIEGRLPGLDDLSRRVAEARRRWSEQTNINGALADFAARLQAILDQEKAALAGIEGDGARLNETQLDLLPRSAGSAIRQLMQYRFSTPEIQAGFDALVQDVRRELLEARFGNLMGAMRTVSGQDIARMRRMIAEINRMLQARQQGEPHDFAGFMSRYGNLFPERPGDLDELLAALANRMAAMSRLVASLSPEQRRELQELSRAVMGDAGMEFAGLSDELEALSPHLPWGQPAQGLSDEPMGLSQVAGAFERLGRLEDLERALKGAHAGAQITDVDQEQLQEALGEQAVADLNRLKRIEQTLERSGMLGRDGGRLELTARGMRKLAERALTKVFEQVGHDRPGGHEDRRTGGPAEPTGATRPWQFGDNGQISAQQTVFNAVARRPAGAAGIKIEPEDFELVEAQSVTRTATALLIDLSFSMSLRGHWVPAKKMALALHALIEGKYPQDDLYLIGFSDYARRLELKDLTAPGAMERVQGTNMQHAFMLAARLLSGDPGATRQVIMVTDGEPTAHLTEGPTGTGSYFQWPPASQTIHKTLAEASRLSSSGIILNIYMLEEDPALTRFMTDLARLTGGRILQAAEQDIGQFVLRDFVRHR